MLKRSQKEKTSKEKEWDVVRTSLLQKTKGSVCKDKRGQQMKA